MTGVDGTRARMARIAEIFRDPSRVTDLTDDDLRSFTIKEVVAACWSGMVDLGGKPGWEQVGSTVRSIGREARAREFAKAHNISLEEARRVCPLIFEGGEEA